MRRSIGVDGDPEVLALARAKPGADAVQWRAGSATALPLPGAGADRVVMSLLLHHLDGPAKRAALAEAARVLRPGGRLHVADWGRPRDPLMRAAAWALERLDGAEGLREHLEGGGPALLADAGFVAVAVHDRLRTGWGSLELLSGAAGLRALGRAAQLVVDLDLGVEVGRREARLEGEGVGRRAVDAQVLEALLGLLDRRQLAGGNPPQRPCRASSRSNHSRRRRMTSTWPLR